MGHSPMRPVSLHAPRSVGSRARLAWTLGCALACGSCRHAGSDAARRRDPERSDGRRRLGAPRRDPAGGRRRRRRDGQASTRIESRVPAAVGEEPLGAGQRSGRRSTSRSTLSAIRHAAPLFTAALSTQFVPGRTALLRIPLESRCIVYPPMPRGASKVPGPLSGPTCTRAGHLHHGDVPVVRRSPRSARALRHQLAHQRARPLQAARRRSPPTCRSEPGSRTTCRWPGDRRCRPKPARKEAITSGSPRA